MKRKERKNDVLKFSLMLGAILAGIGGLRYYHGNTGPLTYLFIGLGFHAAMFGVIAKPMMRPVYKGGMFFADKMSWVVTRVVLTIFYVLVFIPYGLVFRILRKDLLDRYPKPEMPTYWIKREKKFDAARCERMF
ncbi:MAG: SxtJ family membrane protein [Deltaproteobacteria bacterium]|nr:SxtJ family membrane protein [Deltaproteobacteria bacterium]